jgi:hypothetical protein
LCCITAFTTQREDETAEMIVVQVTHYFFLKKKGIKNKVVSWPTMAGMILWQLCLKL